MWGPILSEPLLIIGLVGRYPANYLIRRKPLHNPYNVYLTSYATEKDYAGLPRLSPGYPPVVGRLLTRYAPVCH